MAESWRNSNRTPGRNSGEMSVLLAESGAWTTSFFYQYCAYRACHRVEAVLAEHTRETFNAHVRTALEANYVAVMQIEHAPQDVKQELPVTVHTRGVSKWMAWDDLTNLLSNLHALHAASSGLKGCAKYDHTHLGFARDSATDEDLSLSNALRDVPGVRHLDVDSLLLCERCGKPKMLLECTSDGYVNDTRKMTYMSESMAAALGTPYALVQHAARTRINKLILTESTPDRLGNPVRESRAVTREEFKEWVAMDRPHECKLFLP